MTASIFELVAFLKAGCSLKQLFYTWYVRALKSLIMIKNRHVVDSVTSGGEVRLRGEKEVGWG